LSFGVGRGGGKGGRYKRDTSLYIACCTRKWSDLVGHRLETGWRGTGHAVARRGEVENRGKINRS